MNFHARYFARTLLTVLTLALVGAPSALATPTINSLAPTTVNHGSTVTVSGTVAPIAEGEQVRIIQRIHGAWEPVGAVVETNAAGEWSVTFMPTRKGDIKAVHITDGESESTERFITVRPRITSSTIVSGTVYPYLGATARWKLAPVAYSGIKVRAKVYLGKHLTGSATGYVKNGVLRIKIPTNGVGTFRVKLEIPTTNGYGNAVNTSLQFTVVPKAVGPSSSARWRLALRKGLKFRGIHVSGSNAYDHRMRDSVIAFHKAYRKPRTSSFSASDWRTLTAKRIGVKHAKRGTHVEIDKGRQILMKVRNGKPIMVIHISSGATGNTPVGTHRIQWKGNWVPSLYGGLLYKSMAFQGAYAIHGYPSVPTTPASHGCVRVPMWIAATLYAVTPVGQAVYVYEGPGTTPTSVGKRRSDVPELTGVNPSVWADQPS